MRKNALTLVLLITLVVLLSFVGGLGCGKRSKGLAPSRDTIYVTRTARGSGSMPVSVDLKGWDISVPVVYFTSDTLYVTDTVTVPVFIHDTLYIPISTSRFDLLDGRMRLWVSGYKVSLDRWELDERTATITERKRWSVSAGVGPGVVYSPFTRRVDAGIGLFGGITYNF